ncbi:MAG: T9SS-dependent M36 family metallopeptidase [Flavobacteriales bacterium]|nr:T9SS-dependent M36 family metallopeptidase [Flavobacteriales bacterium]MBP9081013.1 T9SS-dependent M36 family metallopeptidase [Flavobacteriales bacterium]
MKCSLRAYAWLLSCPGLFIHAHAQDPEDVVRTWLQDHRAQWGITLQDATGWEVTDRVADKRGITFIHIGQTAQGLPVAGAVANFAVKGGQVVHAGNRMQPDVARRVGTDTPGITAEEALRAAARHLGLVPHDVHVQERTSASRLLLGTCGISLDPVPAALVYQPVPGQRPIPLAWELVVRDRGGKHWWHMALDAHSGELLHRNDRMVECAKAPGSLSRAYNAMADLGPEGALAGEAAAGGGAAGYRVFPFPTESPVYGAHQLVFSPADPVASPFGWHDTDGMPGAEHTITRGNNAYAAEDLADQDIMGYSPDGGGGLLFDFPYVQEQGPASYLDAAITNLFYTCNVLHDVWYRYGFDEESGNFQSFNYGGSPGADDAVIAQAQDGGGTNNANFGTPPDGSPGVMQMYLWRTSEADTFRVNSPIGLAGTYGIEVAGFGPLLPGDGITADLALVQDALAPVSDACDALLNGAGLAGKIAVVDRGLCTFVSKVQAIQSEGALAVVVVNNVAGGPITMGGDDPGDITIPAVMVSQNDGQLIKDAMLNGPVNATLQGAGLESMMDCDFDNGIIAHEYGHGISNRLTGGPGNVDCLWNDEQMGEGWGDWMGLVLSMRPGDLPETPRGVGNFVTAEGPDGGGIRLMPYTTDMELNEVTYASTNTGAFQETHALGSVWATMLWDLTWALVDEEGFDPDLYTGTGGNNTAMQLVMDGMKLQPCSPGFVDGRDAILAADDVNYGGAHSCLIWHAFARRGLGLSADQGSSFSTTDQNEAFDVPIECISVGVAPISAPNQGFVVAPGPGQGQMQLLFGTPAQTGATVRLIAMDGRMIGQWPMAQGTSTWVLDIGHAAHAAYLVEWAPEGGAPVRRRYVHTGP